MKYPDIMAHDRGSRIMGALRWLMSGHPGRVDDLSPPTFNVAAAMLAEAFDEVASRRGLAVEPPEGCDCPDCQAVQHAVAYVERIRRG